MSSNAPYLTECTLEAYSAKLGVLATQSGLPVMRDACEDYTFDWAVLSVVQSLALPELTNKLAARAGVMSRRRQSRDDDHPQRAGWRVCAAAAAVLEPRRPEGTFRATSPQHRAPSMLRPCTARSSYNVIYRSFHDFVSDQTVGLLRLYSAVVCAFVPGHTTR